MEKNLDNGIAKTDIGELLYKYIDSFKNENTRIKENDEKLFSCHDGCQAPIIGIRNKNKKWELFTISQVIGMGVAKYETKVTDLLYDDLVEMNSTLGLSYIGTCLNHKWGLIQIKNNHTPQCEWKVLSENKYDSLEALLEDLKIEYKN